jgi:xanthine dehydrogenase YagT iron-sulfur-binding subunit
MRLLHARSDRLGRGIAEGHARDEASVREWMSGNICRCSCYPQITAAVLDAARRREGAP